MTATAHPLTLLETLASIHLLSRKWLDDQLPSLAFLALAARRCLPILVEGPAPGTAVSTSR